MTIQLDKRAIRAALEFAATQDIRYYLNGIKIEATKTHTTYVATDGHRMIAVRHEAENEQEAEMIIPVAVAKIASKGVIKTIGGEKVSLTIDKLQYDISTPDGRLIFTPIEGNFPDWRKVVTDFKKPKKRQADKFLCINPVYLKKCFDAYVHLGMSKRFPVVNLHESGDVNHAVNVQCGDLTDFNVAMIVMPCRESTQFLPLDWIKEDAK